MYNIVLQVYEVLIISIHPVYRSRHKIYENILIMIQVYELCRSSSLVKAGVWSVECGVRSAWFMLSFKVYELRNCY